MEEVKPLSPKVNKVIKEVVKEEKQEIMDFIKQTYPVKNPIFLDIRHLWGKYYRLNFWEKNNSYESSIIKSYFIEVKKISEGYKIKNYDKDEAENN